MNTIKIRKATTADLEQVMKLDFKLIEYVKKNYEPEINLTTSKKEMKKIYRKTKKDFRKYVIIVAEIKHKIIGFVSSIIIFSKFQNKKRAYINDIYILPAYRHKGIGKIMIKKLFDAHKNKHIKGYGVGADWKNKTSIKLWKEMGFIERHIEFKKQLK